MDSLAPPLAEKARPSILVGRSLVYPSSTNPRTRFDEASLKELAASMAAPVGIIEPLIVRPHPSKGEGRYEVVAGERRWKAAGIAGIDEIPVIVRELDDAQVLDLQLIENKHRDDIHPLEEARAMERRIKLDRQLTPKGMAKFIGVSERYVQNRLRYLTLVGEAQKAFFDGEIVAAHADLLIRLDADDQKRALKDGLYLQQWDHDAQKNRKVLRSARDFDLWLRENIRLDPVQAAQSGLFPELQKELLVVDGQAHDAKSGQLATLVELTRAWSYQPAKGEPAPYPLAASHWKELKSGEKCEHQARGVIVVGREQGQLLTVCVGYGKCKKHHMSSIVEQEMREQRSNGGGAKNTGKKKAPMQAWERQQAREREQQKLWDSIEKPVVALLATAAKKAKPTPNVLALLVPRGQKPRTFGEYLAHELDGSIYGLKQAQTAAHVLGVDLKPVLAAQSKKKPKPAKKAPKKVAGGRKKK